MQDGMTVRKRATTDILTGQADHEILFQQGGISQHFGITPVQVSSP
jgi:hypothetical protein